MRSAERNANEQDAVARAFNQLVTPSGAKIAHTIRDLALYAQTREEDLAQVLEKLASVRILRPVALPLDQPQTPRYEIFHGVLAPAVLDWRSRYLESQKLAVAQKENRVVTSIRIVSVVILFLLILVNLPFIITYTRDILLAGRIVNEVFTPAELGVYTVIRYDNVIRPNTPITITVDLEQFNLTENIAVQLSGSTPDIIFEGDTLKRFVPPRQIEKFVFVLNEKEIPYNPFNLETETRQINMVFQGFSSKQTAKHTATFLVDYYSALVSSVAVLLVGLFGIVVALYSPQNQIAADDITLVNARASHPQLSPEHRHRLAAQHDALAAPLALDDAGARRCLEADQRFLVQARFPVGREITVRRAGHRVFVDANARRKIARHKIVIARLRIARDDDRSNAGVRQQRKIGSQVADDLLRFDFEQIDIVPRGRFVRECWSRSQGAIQVGIRFGGDGESRRKVHFDLRVAFLRDEQTALRVKSGWLFDLEKLFLVQNVCGRERRMTAQTDLAFGCEPAQAKIVFLFEQKRGLGQIHFCRERPHPLVGTILFHHAHARGIAAKGLIGERIYLVDFHLGVGSILSPV